MKRTKIALTKKKANWAKNRSVELRGTILSYNAAQQLRYSEMLRKLILKMTEETKYKIIKLFKGQTADEFFDHQERVAEDASISSQTKKLLNYLRNRFLKTILLEI